MNAEFDVKIIKDKGLKKTKNRESVLRLLFSRNVPVTADDLYILLKKEQTNIDLSTVYRILNVFVENELVLKTNISGETRALFEINKSEHKHRLICLSCGKMIEIKGCPLIEYEKSVAEMTDFDITKHKLEITGYCPLCKTEKNR